MLRQPHHLHSLLYLYAVYSNLRASGKFEEMSVDVDEAEHSMEMHLPYLCHIMKG